jgi:molybdopterin converting factor small subunit
MATVHLPSSLRALFPDAPKRVELEAGSVAEVIDALDGRWPGMRDRLCNPGPELRQYINVFVDGEPADLLAPVEVRSNVYILPAVAGG